MIPTIKVLGTCIDMAMTGYALFPLLKNGKTPALRENWREISTADPEFIEANWDEDEGWNIGIDTGKSGVIVVDVDVKTGDGIKVWNALLRNNGENDWPDTWTVRTASGGLHFYFEAGDVDMKNSASLVGSWIDIRAQGGYVVGWGSVINDTAYTVINESPPLPVPGWLVEHEARLRTRKDRVDAEERGMHLLSLKMMSKQDVEKAVNGVLDKFANAGEGDRNSLLYWASCRMFEYVAAGRIEDDDAEAGLMEAAEMNGLAADDGRYQVRATINSARRTVA